MTGSTVLSLLEQDHREIDDLLAKAMAGDGEARAAFKSRLARHIRIEDEIIFPALAQSALATPARVLSLEHARLRELLAADDIVAIEEHLSSHNLKEERVLYPAFESPGLEDLVAQIEKALRLERVEG